MGLKKLKTLNDLNIKNKRSESYKRESKFLKMHFIIARSLIP